MTSDNHQNTPKCYSIMESVNGGPPGEADVVYDEEDARAIVRAMKTNYNVLGIRADVWYTEEDEHK